MNIYPGLTSGLKTLTNAYKKKPDPNAWGGGSPYGNFNPATNATYNLYKTANETAGDQLAKRTTNSSIASLSAMSGGMPSSYAVGAATQAGAQAAQPFYQRAVDYLPEAEQQNYNRYQDTLNRQERIYSALGYGNPVLGKPINPATNQYEGNYMAEINRRKATPDTADDAMISDLETARINKIFGDMNLLQKYGGPYRTQAAQDSSFNRGVAEAGLTGVYNGKPTADQAYRDKTYAADQIYKNASLGNVSADNARQWAALNWSMSDKNPDNIYKMSQVNAKGNEGATDYWAASSMGQLNQMPDQKSKQKWLNEHAKEIIQNAGTDVYKFLDNYVNPKSNNYLGLFTQP